MGVKVGGIKTPEIREGGRRIGFKVVDILSGRERVFSSLSLRSHHKVGRYGVDINSFEEIALPALERSLKESKVILIDEIGKMEALSENFNRLIKKIWNSDLICVGTAPSYRLPLVEELLPKSRVFWVRRGESFRVAQSILDEIASLSIL